jgi:cob(I)alamin adenosyltransferase
VASGGLEDDVLAALNRVQNDLFDVGADLCTPVEPDPRYPPLRVVQEQVDALEELIDRFNADLSDLRSFVLPGGTAAAAHLHVARTVVRRAERSTWAALDQHGDTMNPLTATYLNRCSDLLFVLARYANREQGDVLWVPGANR